MSNDQKGKLNQKQIAKRYSGNLDYFSKPHYFRSLRARILIGGIITSVTIVAFFFLWDAIASEGSGPDQLLKTLQNPGPISQAHADFAMDCAQCHGEANLFVQGNLIQSPVDASCIDCHPGFELHQPNMPREHSCTACHHEHLTDGPMKPVNDANCASCHGSDDLMAQARELDEKGESGKIPEHAFDYTAEDGHVYFKPARPEEGYTAVFTQFDQGHPAFQIHRENLSDPNTLDFNHAIHMTGESIPDLNGRPLNCADCHEPDASGMYMRPISYEAHCQDCHALQFDMNNPDMELPHGNAEDVLIYLAGLPLHYESKAMKLGITDKKETMAFAATQLMNLKKDLRSTMPLEEKIFFEAGGEAEAISLGNTIGKPCADYPGCIYCHEVNRDDMGRPQVTAPVTPDRWMGQSLFNHAKHTHMECADCHQVEDSELTSDILMPPIENCLDCHSQKGKIVHSCQTCHGYHAPSSSQGALWWIEQNSETVASE